MLAFVIAPNPAQCGDSPSINSRESKSKVKNEASAKTQNHIDVAQTGARSSVHPKARGQEKVLSYGKYRRTPGDVKATESDLSPEQVNDRRRIQRFLHGKEPTLEISD